MSNITHSLFEELTATLTDFVTEIDKHDENAKYNKEWSVKDLLCHVAYWHQYYLQNLKSEAQGRIPFLLSGKYKDLNEAGINSVKQYSKRELLAKLAKSHTSLKRTILNTTVHQMTYRLGEKPYTIDKFLETVNSHIKSHTKTLKKLH